MDVDSGSSSSATLAATQGLTRAEGLYFEDCGLIIQAENTLFRISREYLASQSPVFRDMLSLPPPQTADMMDGCPFVQLPDKAEDVTVFLKALMFSDFFEPHPAPTTFAILTGVLRMSHKYDINHLRKRALVHISANFPITLEQFSVREKSGWYMELTANDLAMLSVLARELSFEWILPSAFYDMCAFGSKSTILRGPNSIEDKIQLMSACRSFDRMAVTDMLDFLWPDQDPVDGCISFKHCSKAKIQCRRMAETWRRTAQVGPLGIWEPSDFDGLHVCDACLANSKAQYQTAQQAFWGTLPETFGLPNWIEVARLEAEALK
ncbi:BTB domain-containing protein [Favolaschia claudopus]|uniref:BTB domain-containing protein n=1 Tax=Favolaschia claudopus TaxID=2862362 RepID=A0AAW0EI81_9AGAR